MGSTKTQRDEDQADEVAFLFWQLGNLNFSQRKRRSEFSSQ
jgi:hypothetical protein